MKTKILFYALPALILTTIHLAEAQQARKIPWIGYLASAGFGPSSAFIQDCKISAMSRARTLAFVFRTAEGHSQRYADLADGVVRLKVDITGADSSGSLGCQKGHQRRFLL